LPAESDTSFDSAPSFAGSVSSPQVGLDESSAAPWGGAVARAELLTATAIRGVTGRLAAGVAVSGWDALPGAGRAEVPAAEADAAALAALS
jgi:hypothetical protein